MCKSNTSTHGVVDTSPLSTVSGCGQLSSPGGFLGVERSIPFFQVV